MESYKNVVYEIRGRGIIMGMKWVVKNKSIIKEMREEKIISVGEGENVVRIMKKLIKKKEEESEELKKIEKEVERI